MLTQSTVQEVARTLLTEHKTKHAFTITADNCWNGGVVLGLPITNWQGFAFESATTRLWVNGEPAGEGAVRDALGHPFEAVAWLANLLNERAQDFERLKELRRSEMVPFVRYFFVTRARFSGLVIDVLTRILR